MDIRNNLLDSPFKDEDYTKGVPGALLKAFDGHGEIYPSVPLHHALDEQAALLAKQRAV